MCGRFTLTDPTQLDAEALGVALLPPLSARWNVAPPQPVLLVRRARDGGREALLARWGLIPSWAKDPAIGNKLANARAETLAEKPSFRTAWARRRGLVVADGFFEWQVVPGARSKQPWWITMRDRRPFTFGALWETWTAPDGETVVSCTLVTTAPNALMAPIHDRMPVIVAPQDRARWLGEGADAPPADLAMPYPADAMRAERVSTWVNTPAHDDADCVKPLAPDDDGT